MQKKLFIVLNIAILFSVTHSLFGLKLGNYPTLVRNKVDVFDLENKQFQSGMYFDSLFPETDEYVDFENSRVGITAKIGGFQIAPIVYLSFDEYFDNVFKFTFDKLVIKETISFYQQEEREMTSGLIPDLVFDLPKFARSKTVRRIFGNKAGRLSLTGTEKLTISATSTKNDNIALSENSNSTSFTPKMKQKLNMQLRGTIGEKIHVDLKYNSDQEESFFDSNNINIRYEGFEDEIVQKVEAGNISLNLPGSSIGSMSSSQGLFGVRADLQVGDLYITSIMSQEEGQKNKKTFQSKAQADSSVVNDKDYSRRDRYFIVNPYRMYQLYQNGDTIEGTNTPIPPGWVGNAIKLSPTGDYYITQDAAQNAIPKNGTLKVYMDDLNATNNTATIESYEEIDTGSAFTPQFDLLEDGVDYNYDYNTGILTMLKTIRRNYTIGVRYETNSGLQIPAPPDLSTPPEMYDGSSGKVLVKYIRISNQDYNPEIDPTVTNFETEGLTNPNTSSQNGLPINRFYTWHYQLRNVYSLNAKGISNDGFDLRVFMNNISDNSYDYDIPTDVESAGYTTLNEYLKLDTNGDGKVDGSDVSVNLSDGLIFYPFIEPFKPLGDELIYQKENESISSKDYKYKMVIKGQVGTDEISLGQTGILRGSVTVKVNGKEQKENIDYIMDYDFGRLTFLTAAGKDPSAKIEVDYEFKSGFGLASRQMFGLRLDYKRWENFTLGGTFLYRTEKVQDKRPKIGEENVDLMLTDIDATLDVKPRFMTDLVNWIPFIETDVESQLKVSGEFALSMPKIYGDPDSKKQEAYIDDMEGILDEYPMGISRPTWSPASSPLNSYLTKGRIHWFNPDNIKMKEVYDPSTLNQDEQDEDVQVLAMKLVKPEISQPNSSNRAWQGVMKYIGNQLDFSEKKYIEILVKVDDAYNYGNPKATLKIDLGDISEDFYTYNNGENFLNTEDGVEDGVIDGLLDARTEDIGLDGIKDGSPNEDLYDKFDDDKDSYGDFLHINGTEGNNRLDSEDLNANGSLDKLNRYFQFSISLDDEHSEFLQSEFNGWKLYKIPINNKKNYDIFSSSVINPTFSKISYARMWFEYEHTTRIKVAEFNIVGNKWEERPILTTDKENDYDDEMISEDALIAHNTSILAGITDNQKDSHYTPPSDTYETKDNVESFEQSLTLSINNLQEKQFALVKKKNTKSTNLLSYGKLKFWVYPELLDGDLNENDKVNIVLRVGSDSTIYYEYKETLAPIRYQPKMGRSLWHEIAIDFSDLTELKNLLVENPTQDYAVYTKDNKTYRIKGNVTLSNYKEMNLGIEVPEGSKFSGKIYFDDIRVANPYEDVGYKVKGKITSKFADLLTTSLDVDRTTDNFINAPNRNSSSKQNKSMVDNLKFNSNMKLNKFLKDDWKVSLPLSFNYSRTEKTPRYKENSDILRKDLSAEEKKREKTTMDNYSSTISFSKSKVNNPWIDYTAGSFTASAKVGLKKNLSPSKADTTATWGGNMSHKLNLDKAWRGFEFSDNFKFNLIPSNFDNTLTFDASSPDKYKYTMTDTLNYWKPEVSSSNKNKRTLNTSNKITFPILTGKSATYLNTTYELSINRDLTYKNYISNFNVGEQTSYKQNYTYSFTPQLFDDFWDISSDGSIRFDEKRSQLSNNHNDDEKIKFKHNGSVNRTTGFAVTLKNSSLLQSLSEYLGNDDDEEKEDNTKDDKNTSKVNDTIKNDDKSDIAVNNTDKNSNDDKDFIPKSTLEPEDKEINQKAEILLLDWKKLQTLVADAKDDKALEKYANKLNDIEKELVKLGYGDKINRNSTAKNVDNDKEKNTKKSIFSGLSDITFAKFIGWLANIDDIDLSYDNNYIMNYKDMTERPNYRFQLGIPYSLKNELINSKENNNSFDASTGFSIKRMSTDISYSHSDKKRWSTSSKHTVSTTFPDVTLSFNDIQGYFGLSDYLTSSSITTSYLIEKSENGKIENDKPDTKSEKVAFSPLVSLRGNWINNIETSFSYSIVNTTSTTDKISFDFVRKGTTQSVSSNFSWRFSAKNGFQIPLIGSSIYLKNDMTFRTNFTLDKTYETEKGNSNKIVSKNTINYTIAPGLSYVFHRNIKGGADYSYKLNSNKKTHRDVKTQTLAIWIEITF